MSGGGYPSQVWMVGGGTLPHPMSGGGGTLSQVWVGGYTISGLGGYPISGGGGQYPMSGGYPISRGVPHIWGGTPCPGGGYPMSRGTPCPHLCPPPPNCTEQHSEHLLRGRRCASCVHAGGLSCFVKFFW